VHQAPGWKWTLAPLPAPTGGCMACEQSAQHISTPHGTASICIEAGRHAASCTEIHLREHNVINMEAQVDARHLKSRFRITASATSVTKNSSSASTFISFASSSATCRQVASGIRQWAGCRSSNNCVSRQPFRSITQFLRNDFTRDALPGQRCNTPYEGRHCQCGASAAANARPA
jgi:hypothetical protein